MSATPKLTITPEDTARGLAAFELIEPMSVIEAGMIKKEIIINKDLEALPSEEVSSQEMILEAAVRKRFELQLKYESLGLQINPLCLIQLPNSEQGDAKKEAVLTFLRDRNITEDNGKVALWFSDQKSDDLDYLAEADNPVEFLLFKQAIDTGWDCPRAQVLIKLRDIQSYTFEVQTLGRILRMPQQKHYADEDLNIAYVFTNLKTIDVSKEEFNPNMIKHLYSKRKDNYKPLSLRSYHRSRIDYGDVTFSFQKVLENTFCQVFGIPQEGMINPAENLEKIRTFIETDIKRLEDGIFTNVVLDSSALDSRRHIDESLFERQISLGLSSLDVYESFNALIKSNLQGFAPKRSVPAVRQAIYVWFKKFVGLSLSNGGLIEIQKYFLYPKNFEFMSIALSRAIEAYAPIKREEVLKKIEESHYDWDIKEFEYYNEHSVERFDSVASIYDPLYLNRDRSNPERTFESYLESHSSSILWWFKNGEGKKDYFGLKYEDDGYPRTFYPDYLIQLKSGKLFIGDTKSGQTAKDSLQKALALENFFKHSKVESFGGIVLQDKAGKWRFNSQPSVDFDIKDLQHWEYLDEYLKS
jgi:type III restriction enzyme